MYVCLYILTCPMFFFSPVIPCEEDASISDSSVTTSVPALSDIQLSHSHHGIYSLEPNNILVPPQQLDDHNEVNIKL